MRDGSDDPDAASDGSPGPNRFPPDGRALPPRPPGVFLRP
jgi:hypothetical protein